MNRPTPSLQTPDGIDPAHSRAGGLPLNWLPLAILSAVMLLALLGLFGGGRARPIVTEGAAARLEVTTPRVIRNGEFFETRIRILARQPIDDATLSVSTGLWRDMTINTMIPAPTEEKAEQGAFRFAYGRLEAGDVLDIKIDGQINPPLFAGTHGDIGLEDGDRPLLRIPLAITVLP